MTATHPEQDIQQYPAHFEPPRGVFRELGV